MKAAELLFEILVEDQVCSLSIFPLIVCSWDLEAFRRSRWDSGRRFCFCVKRFEKTIISTYQTFGNQYIYFGVKEKMKLHSCNLKAMPVSMQQCELLGTKCRYYLVYFYYCFGTYGAMHQSIYLIISIFLELQKTYNAKTLKHDDKHSYGSFPYIISIRSFSKISD